MKKQTTSPDIAIEAVAARLAELEAKRERDDFEGMPIDYIDETLLKVRRLVDFITAVHLASDGEGARCCKEDLGAFIGAMYEISDVIYSRLDLTERAASEMHKKLVAVGAR